MANVGTAVAGKTLIGAGNGASPTYADIGTNSGLTARGVVIAEGSGAFQATAAGSVGQVLQSGGAGANPSYSTATYPSTTTINQLLYSSSANTVSGLTSANSATLVSTSTGVPAWSGSMTNGQLIIGSTGSTPVAASLTAGTGITITPGAGSITISASSSGETITDVTLIDDFLSYTLTGASTVATFGDLNWTLAITTGGGASIGGNTFDSSHPGNLTMFGATLATATALLGWSQYCFKLNGGAISFTWIIRIEDLATVAEDYVFRIGFGSFSPTIAIFNPSPTTDFQYGVYFEYNRATSANWLIKTANAGVRTSTTTGTAVAADSWITLTAEINAAATSVEYFINGSSVGTIATNIPNGGTNAEALTQYLHFARTAGTTLRVVYADLFLIHYQVTR